MIYRALLISLLFFTKISATNAYVSDQSGHNIFVVNPLSQSIVATIPVGAGSFYITENAAGSKVYVALKNNQVAVIDTASNTVIKMIPTQGPFFLNFTPDGSKLYVTNFFAGNTVTVIDPITDTIIAVITTDSNPSDVEFSPDSSKAYVANYNGTTVTVINTYTNQVIAAIPLDNVNELVVTPDGSKIYASSDITNAVSVINAKTNSVSPVTGVFLYPQVAGGVSPDGSKLYVLNGIPNTVSVVSTSTNAEFATIPVGMFPDATVFTADGSTAYIANSNDNTISVINVANSAFIKNITIGSFPVVPAFTPDGSQLLTPNGSGSVSFITIATSAVTTIPSGVSLFDITFPQSIVSSGSIQGKQIKNRFLTQSELVNVLTWDPPPPVFHSFPGRYLIYRNASLTDLAGTVPGSGPLRFVDHNLKKNQTMTYFIISENAQGEQWNLGPVTVQPLQCK